MKRNGVFIPCYDTDYDKAKQIKEGIPLACNIRKQRNATFNAKYHKLIDRAWDCLNEQQIAFFGSRGKEAFRKSMEVTAGFYEPIYNFDDKKWQKAPISTSFDRMTEEEFQEVYTGVYDAIRALLTNKSLSEETFDTIFENF